MTLLLSRDTRPRWKSTKEAREKQLWTDRERPIEVGIHICSSIDSNGSQTNLLLRLKWKTTEIGKPSRSFRCWTLGGGLTTAAKVCGKYIKKIPRTGRGRDGFYREKKRMLHTGLFAVTPILYVHILLLCVFFVFSRKHTGSRRPPNNFSKMNHRRRLPIFVCDHCCPYVGRTVRMFALNIIYYDRNGEKKEYSFRHSFRRSIFNLK